MVIRHPKINQSGEDREIWRKFNISRGNIKSSLRHSAIRLIFGHLSQNTAHHVIASGPIRSGDFQLRCNKILYYIERPMRYYNVIIYYNIIIRLFGQHSVILIFWFNKFSDSIHPRARRLDHVMTHNLFIHEVTSRELLLLPLFLPDDCATLMLGQ